MTQTLRLRPRPEGSGQALRQAVLAYLRDHNTMTVATLGPDGPWAAAVFYVNEGFLLYFLSETDTRHSRNIAVNPQVAVTIHEDYHDWRRIKGIQLEGQARLVSEPAEVAKAMKLYGAKYPFLRDLAIAPAELARALARTRFYKVTPTHLYFTDNEKGFGHREELDIEGAEGS